MSELDMEVLEMEEEVDIEKAISCEKFDFPAVSIGKYNIYFNARCRDYFDKEYVKVSKSTNLVCFRPCNIRKIGYHKNITGSCGGFSIPYMHIKNVTSLPVGKSFRLYKLKDGGYAIKRYKPIQDGE